MNPATSPHIRGGGTLFGRLRSRLRAFGSQVRSAPATTLLCASWLLVYGLMAWTQGSIQSGQNLLSGGISTAVSNAFGHLTAAQFVAGEYWRPLSATFIHYSLVHLSMNLVGLWLLGPLIETWYGWAQFLALYVVLGFAGNAMACLAKLFGPGLHPGWALWIDHPSGGGSTVICGLVGLLAVVGWRSRRQLGNALWVQMVGVLALTALLGLFLDNIDNLGHAGGTLVGLVAGLFERVLLRNFERNRANRYGVAAALALGVAVGGQYGLDLAQARVQAVLNRIQDQSNGLLAVFNHLGTLERLYLERARQDGSLPPVYQTTRARLPFLIRQQLDEMERIPSELRNQPTAQAYQKVVQLAQKAIRSEPSPAEVLAFEAALRPLVARARDLLIWNRTRAELLRVARP